MSLYELEEAIGKNSEYVVRHLDILRRRGLVSEVYEDENNNFGDLHIKDLNNALDCAHAVGAPLPMTAQVQEVLQYLHNNGCGNDDHSAIAKYYEKLADIKIGR